MKFNFEGSPYYSFNDAAGRPSADEVHIELEKFKDSSGQVDMEAILRVAKTNPVLQGFLTWDNKDAADQMRWLQLKALIEGVWTDDGPVYAWLKKAA